VTDKVISEDAYISIYVTSNEQFAANREYAQNGEKSISVLTFPQ
jgi:hypothetical protein